MLFERESPEKDLICRPALADTRILFIGNSFTFAALSPVSGFHPETVHDLNGGKVGGLPALFKEFTEEAGLHYDVSLETSGGKGLDWHYANRADVIGKPWDTVVMHGFSTMDAARPGDPTLLVTFAGQVARLLHEKNRRVRIFLMATWTRADQTYTPKGHWYGQPVEAMAQDVRAGYDRAAAASPFVRGVIPVGETWLRAIRTGFADANPYDGIDAGKVDLWARDHYHGSTYGYYLEALTVFGAVTGLDPRSLGGEEAAARELGISPREAAAMERIAYDQLVANGSKTLKRFRSVVAKLKGRQKCSPGRDETPRGAFDERGPRTTARRRSRPHRHRSRASGRRSLQVEESPSGRQTGLRS